MNSRTTVLVLALAASACRSARPSVVPTNPGTLSSPSSGPLQQLQRDIDAVLSAPALDRASWGVMVKSLARGENLYALNSHKLLMPASNMKVATLAVAAERLGWDFTFETRLVAAGTIHDGMLDGDLVVVGSGDPSIDDWDGAAGRMFRDWADRLKAAGVRTISGRLVGDDRAFAGEPFGIGWAWDDLDNSYGTGVGALQFNENTARVVVEAGASTGDPAAVSLQQSGTNLVVRSTVTTSASGTPAAFGTRRLVGSPSLDVFGSLPVGTRSIVNVSVVNPTVYFLTALRDGLAAAGIDVHGGVVDIDDVGEPPAGTTTTLLAHQSPPLSTLAVTMMKNSQNLFAETLLRSVGGRPATLDAARVAAESSLRTWGVGPAEILIADGSGLSRNDLITPEAMLTILAHVERDQRLRGPFERALPVAGVDGTLAQRMKGTAAEGNAHAKTGSFSNARALAGYVSSADGESLAFSILANNFGVSPDVVESAEDAIVVRLAQFSRK